MKVTKEMLAAQIAKAKAELAALPTGAHGGKVVTLKVALPPFLPTPNPEAITMAPDVTLTLSTPAKSLAGTDTLYAVGQVRLVDSEGRVRYQCGPAEWTYMVPPDIAEWLAKVPAPWKSRAGTSTMYAPCLIRPDAKGMRVQVPCEPGLNRDWGGEWIHAGPCPSVVASIIAAATPADPPDGTIPAGGHATPPPSEHHAPVADDDDDASDEDDDK